MVVWTGGGSGDREEWLQLQLAVELRGVLGEFDVGTAEST